MSGVNNRNRMQRWSEIYIAQDFSSSTALYSLWSNKKEAHIRPTGFIREL